MSSHDHSLTLVGSGIKSIAHVTIESKAHIQECDHVLYLVNEPVMKQWIEKYSIRHESLDPLYERYPHRRDAYTAITNHILNTLTRTKHLCVVLYGHPTVFAKPGLDAVHLAKQAGYYTRILPGVSALDCLFADLMIDPGTHGCQLYDATLLLRRATPINNQSHLIVWQLDALEICDQQSLAVDSAAMQRLCLYLSNYYPENHIVTLYQAAQYPGFSATTFETPLNHLSKQLPSRICLLSIPPILENA